MSIEALVFDVDGTLADTEEVHRMAFNLAFEELGLGWHWTQAEYRSLLSVTGGKDLTIRRKIHGGNPGAGINMLFKIKVLRIKNKDTNRGCHGNI